MDEVVISQKLIQNIQKSDYPLAPEVMKVKSNMLSEKQAEICKLTNGSKEPEE